MEQHLFLEGVDVGGLHEGVHGCHGVHQAHVRVGQVPPGVAPSPQPYLDINNGVTKYTSTFFKNNLRSIIAFWTYFTNKIFLLYFSWNSIPQKICSWEKFANPTFPSTVST
jgi:hypothetical protein